MPVTARANWDVVVVGGGVAGLTTAVALSARRLKVLVLEILPDLGGRALSIVERTTGDVIPLGPHILLSEYHNVLRLLDVLGTRHQVVWQDETFVTIVTGPHEIPMRISSLPAPFHFIPSLIRDRAISSLDWMSNIPLTLWALGLREEDIARLDSVSAADTLRRWKVSKRFCEHFWAFTANAILNTSLEKCSAGALMRFYRRLVGQKNYRLGFAGAGLGELFVPAACELIRANGGEINCRAEVNQILLTARRACGVALADGRRFNSMYVVAALPPRALLACADASILSTFPRLAEISAIDPCSYVSVFLWFDRKVDDRRFWARTYSGQDLSCDFYDLSNIQPGWRQRPSVIASNIIDATRVAGLSDAAIVARTLAEVRENVPNAREAEVIHSKVHRIPMAIPFPYVNMERHRLDEATPIPGLLLAGDWLSTGLPASMESACLSGWRAAERVLEDLGRAERMAVPHPDLDPLARHLGRATAGVLNAAVWIKQIAIPAAGRQGR